MSPATVADSRGAPNQGVNGLARLVLSTQLEILNSFLPASCWLVAVHQNDQPEIVSAIGERATIADALVACLADRWDVHDREPSLVRRTVVAVEHEALVTAGCSGWSPTHAYGARLRGTRGEVSGIVLGCIREAEHDSQPGVHSTSHEIELCLHAIARTLNLYAALSATEKLVYETQRRAQIDPLTQVLNRAGWNRRLRNAAATGVEVAVGLLDLDYLKFINDTRGHLAGDALLQSTARAIRSVLRANDSVARLGGDEFAVLLFDVTPDVVAYLRERLRHTLADANVSASIGVALRSESGSLANAMQLADRRMYQEKHGKQRARAVNVNAGDFE